MESFTLRLGSTFGPHYGAHTHGGVCVCVPWATRHCLIMCESPLCICFSDCEVRYGQVSFES